LTKLAIDLSNEIDQINDHLSNLRDNSPYDDEINDLIDYIIQRGGKRIRPLICLLSFEMISNKERDDNSFAAACAVEVIHNASLLVDDIFDKDIFRRQEKSFYLQYSTFAALSLSYSMSSLALSIASRTKALEVVEVLIKALHTLSSSLFLEQKFRNGVRKMTQDDALKLIDRKTSCLFEAGSLIGVILGTSEEKDRALMKLFGKLFGRAFQLRDDILSLTSTENELGKSGVWTDITNRIQTYIVLEAIELANDEDKKILSEYYVQKLDHPPSKVKQIIVDSGAIESIKKIIISFTNEADEILEKYPPSAARDKLKEITASLTLL